MVFELPISLPRPLSPGYNITTVHEKEVGDREGGERDIRHIQTSASASGGRSPPPGATCYQAPFDRMPGQEGKGTRELSTGLLLLLFCLSCSL